MGNGRKSFRAKRFSLNIERLEGRIVPSLDVTRYHYDNQSTGADLSETQLTPSNVNPASFGKLYSTPVDGMVYTQPLVVNNVAITGSNAGVYSAVAFAATEHDSVYAINSANGAVLWQRTFLDTSNPNDFLPGAAAVTTVPTADLGVTDVGTEIGISGTPVIDASSSTLFVDVKTKEIVNGTAHYVQRLHALQLADGSDRVASFLIGDTSNGNTNNTPIYVNGTGDGSNNGVLQFNAARENNHPALSLLNGKVYLEWASHGDVGTYHGWVAEWDVSNVASGGAMVLAGVLCLSPNGAAAGIWGGGGGLTFEPDGSAFYFETGNGFGRAGNPTLDANGFPTDANYYESVVKVQADPSSSAGNQGTNPNGWGLKITDYFTPFNVVALDNADEDLGSGSPLVLPDSAGIPNHPHLMVAAGKEGKTYLIDRDNMGKFNANGDNVVNAVFNGTNNTPPTFLNGSLSTPAYYHGYLYWVSGYSGTAQSFIIGADGTIQPVSQTANGSFGYAPGSVVVSANGNDPTTGVVWIMDRANSDLHAYSALTLNTELWNSNDRPGDNLDSMVRFQPPVVANGQVYIGTITALTVYGLTGPGTQTQAPNVPANLSAQALSGSAVELSWTDSTVSPNFATSYLIQDSTDNVNFATVATSGQETTSLTVTGLSASTTYYFRIAGTNNVGTSNNSAVATATTTSQTGTTPTAPVGLGATPAGPSAVSLTWNNTAAIETGFTLTRATDSLFTKNVITEALGAAPFYFTDTAAGMTPGGTYYFKIQASNASGLSSSSNTAAMTIPLPPPQPTNASAIFQTGPQILVSWTDNAGPYALGYQILRSVDGAAYLLYQNLPETSHAPPSTLSFTDTAVSLGHSYSYEIEARNVSGFSAAAIANASITSTIASITPVNPNPCSTPVSSVTIKFSGPVSGFSLANLQLQAAGSSNLLTGAQTLTTSDNATWILGNLAGLTSPTGRVAGFTLSLSPAGITDAGGNPLTGGTSTSFIEVDPALTLVGTTLTVSGTSANDTFTFTAGSSEFATLNGVTYTLDRTVVSTIQFQGIGGNDSAALNAAGSGNIASLGPGSGTLQGTGYLVSASGVSTLTINAAGSTDSAYLQAPSGAVFASRPGYAYVTSGTMTSEVAGFTTVQANAAVGSSDSAYLYDNGGKNTFAARPGYAYQTAGSTITSLVGFQSVHASAAATSTDSAYLYDNGGSNTFAARPGYAYQSAGNSLLVMTGFQSVQMTAAATSNDRAYLYDNGGKNTFAARPGYAYLSAGGTIASVVSFQMVQATAASTSTDSAYVNDNGGSNTFAARPGYAFLSAGTSTIAMVGFQAIQMTAAATSHDSAALYDQSGTNTFIGLGAVGTLSGTGYSITLNAFKSVTAYGAAGATNRAHVWGLDFLFSGVGRWTFF
jgi:hypothetical protein